LREYSERVVHKLEQKLGELERSNALAESALEALSAEMTTKQRLIDELQDEIRQRVEREAELRRERDFNTLIIETADVFICSSDVDDTITLFSPGAERMSGYAAAEVLGKNVVDVFAPQDERERRRYLHQANLKAGGTSRLTNTWVMRSGEERTFEWSSTVTRDEQGLPSAIIRFGIDVTERSLVVATERVMGVIDLSVLLNRSITELLETTCAQITDEFGLAAVWTALADDSGTCSLRACAGPVADAAIRMLGGDDQAECPVGDYLQMEQPIHLVLGHNEVPQGWRRMAESERLHAALLLPIRSEGGVAGVMVALTYAERGFPESASRALESVADRLGVGLMFAGARERLMLQSAALESAGNAIVLAEVSGRVGWLNSAFTSLTGYRFDEVIGRNLFGDDDGYREATYHEAWESVVGGERWQGEIVNRTKDGRPYSESVTLAPVIGRDGTVSHVVIVKADVSERRKFERLKNDFVAMVSHELRTPLTTIIGYADLLTSGSQLDASRVTAAVRSIQTSGHRMRDIVEELLSVTEMLAESIDVKPQAVDVAELVRETAARTAVDPSHKLVLDLPDVSAPAHIDPRAIGHALSNLLDNAIKYSPDGGRITVGVRTSRELLTIFVADEGVGIEGDRLEELFESFVQTDMSSTRSFGGIGLGLFVANGLVKAHGGEITVRSRPGAGSVFEIRLGLDSIARD
jgi:PAS domain S-box-containing protein